MSTTLNENLLLAIPLAPLAGSLIAGLLGKTIGRAGAHSVTILGVAISFVLAVIVFFDVLNGGSFNATIYEWMTVGKLKFEVGFLVDSLTAMMMCVVTFVSLMVHIYTIGYMAEDDGYQRFFSYISLFTFSMLMLVMSNNFLQLFFGWEAVGLVSYLLIGFYFTRPTAIYANMKAFIVNRIGDFGFLLGIGLLFAFAGSMNYGDVFAKRTELAAFVAEDAVDALRVGGGIAFVDEEPGDAVVDEEAESADVRGHDGRAACGSFERDVAARQIFKPGDKGRAKNINPATHTRLPRYVRGHVGIVERINGSHVFPDSAAHGKGENPQWLYTVVFSGRDLWGDDADPSVKVSVDAFEPYLERA